MRNFGLYIDGKPAHRGASANGLALRDEQPSTQSVTDTREFAALWFVAGMFASIGLVLFAIIFGFSLFDFG